MGLADGVCRQVGCLMFMVLAPVLWFQSLGITDSDSAAALDPGYVTMTVGILLTVEAFLYLQLPLDMIPDFVPIIGKCDDAIAYAIAFLGALLTVFGAQSWISSFQEPRHLE